MTLPPPFVMIVAAGDGVRAGLPVPKQYYGEPSPLGRVLAALSGHYPILVVHGAHHWVWIEPLRAQYPNVHFCVGGDTRADSVLCGLRMLARAAFPALSPHVLIHDAARPSAPLALFARVAALLEQGHQAVCPVLPISDTLCHSDGQRWQGAMDRTGIYRVQTPQGFDRVALNDAFEKTGNEPFTDEGSRMHAAGYAVHLTDGAPENTKITRPEDVVPSPPQKQARWITGWGFDVHAFDPSKQTITLCGLCLPASQGLSGHSDADVALHALTDALLGALALGDIGDHFPPTDPAWQGADSRLFLGFALQQLAQHQGVLEHVDITIMGETPKIAPHRDRYRSRLAELCALSLNQVSVKATTTEKLGFLGRKEGLAAQAAVTVRFGGE
ncbi:MAG: 2-C-methyl-D-erythritol 2,4-cyclodiphosphate synthase [Alphaproteobacteria bacterium]